MPLYEYVCRECGRRFEVLQRVGAGADEVSCPHCASRSVGKQLSTFAASVQGGSTTGSLPCGASSSASCGSGGFS